MLVSSHDESVPAEKFCSENHSCNRSEHSFPKEHRKPTAAETKSSLQSSGMRQRGKKMQTKQHFRDTLKRNRDCTEKNELIMQKMSGKTEVAFRLETWYAFSN